MYTDVRVFIRQCHTDEDGFQSWNVDETQVKGGMDLFDELEKGAMIVRTEVHQPDGAVSALHYRQPDVNADGEYAFNEYPEGAPIKMRGATLKNKKSRPSPVPGTAVYTPPPQITPMITALPPLSMETMLKAYKQVEELNKEMYRASGVPSQWLKGDWNIEEGAQKAFFDSPLEEEDEG